MHDQENRSWHLLQFKPNSHRLAERNLHRQGFATFLPLREMTRRSAGSFHVDLRPLFPGYMFVEFDISTAAWRKVNSTFGVSRLVSFGGKPRAVPVDLIEQLKARCDKSGKLLPPPALREGESVELLSGPFSEFVATVEEVKADQRVWLLLDFMGKNTRVQVETKDVTRSKSNSSSNIPV